MTPTPSTIPRLVKLPTNGPAAPVVTEPVLEEAPVVAHRQVGPDTWLLTLHAPVVAARVQPGQFAMLTLAREGETAPVLPRPMALYAWDRQAGTVDVMYRVVGDGTRVLATWRVGERMLTVGPVGRGFSLLPAATRVLLLGRGIGTCSLTALAETAAQRDIRVAAVTSARTPETIIGADFYASVGVQDVLAVHDEDGSSDVPRLRPRLAALLAEGGVDQIFVCGAERLLRLGAELGERFDAMVQVSLEAHMACGLGYCHGCSTGYAGLADEAPLVCHDGPVFQVARA
ncbi:MAG: dihydroorotate oxidase electron transfer subunit [Chloroflexi bacterium]|nr:dihydroorotate oxidase electron transfer subunit [Chloroflexota bacterium]